MKQAENPDGVEQNQGGNVNFANDEEGTVSGLRSNRILLGIGGVIAFCGMTILANTMFSSPKPLIPEDQELPTTPSRGRDTLTNALPDKYSDIAKYAAKAEADERAKQRANANANQQAPVQYNSNARRENNNNNNNSSYSNNAPTQAAPSGPPPLSAEEKQAKKELQEAIESPISFTLRMARDVSSSVSGNGTSTMPTAADNFADPNAARSAGSYGGSFRGGSYDLRAGSVIQATLLTGITSDMAGGDCVAQVRQNIYDSQTGEHLLIPQGSKLIGKYGSAGSRGNARIGISFTRIILPSGESIALPSMNAIDGIGYPGLKDQYTEHNGKLFGATFMSALIAAAATAATGGDSGSDNRSTGQEAVSGAVAEVLDAASTIIDRQASVQPTITIRPGFEFSVYINGDISIPEYFAEYDY